MYRKANIKRSNDQLFKICIEFFAFNWSLSDVISTHLAKLRTIWSELNNELKDIGENKLFDLILVCKVLQILPCKFDTVKSSCMLLPIKTKAEHLIS